MNTTIVDGVEIKQGDEVEASDFIEGVWTRCEFLADIGPEYKCRYITTFTELNRKQFITNRYIRPIPKKQRVPLTQEDIIKKYWNGAIRSDGCIYKIVNFDDKMICVVDRNGNAPTFTYSYLNERGKEITSGPDSNGSIVWEPCWKEV